MPPPAPQPHPPCERQVYDLPDLCSLWIILFSPRFPKESVRAFKRPVRDFPCSPGRASPPQPHLSLDPLHSAHRSWRIRLTPDPAWQHPAPLTRSTTHSYPSCNMSFTSPAARELSRLMCLRCDPASGACFSRRSSELIDDGVSGAHYLPRTRECEEQITLSAVCRI